MTDVQRISISTRWLLAIYAVVPLALIAVLVDRLWLGGALRVDVIRDEREFVLYHLIAGTPHILASNVILFTNKEYVRAYARRLQGFTLAVIAVLILGGLLLPHVVMFAIVGVVTVVHVLRQQIGIGRGLCRLHSPLYDAWGWLAIALGALLYNTLYLGGEMEPGLARVVHVAMYVLCGVVIAASFACHVRIQTRLGRLFLWANTAMAGVSLYLFVSGYPLLATLPPRIVHDVTAFTFYAVHDYNRHHPTPRNGLYRVLKPLGLGTLWVSPVLAIALTLLITRVGDSLVNTASDALFGMTVPHAVSFYFLLYLTLLHYFTEAFTWRSGSPYRRHVTMAT